jgi:methylated-DNA-protein-cysteine methyltransferase-like protein
MTDLSYNKLVYEVTRQVPEGKVTSYGAIAAALGDPRKAREVGWALNVNPKDDPAPAHRVVNKEGRLSGGWAFGSPDVQRGLLEAEGVTFLPDGRVDMALHFWDPAGEPSLPPPDPSQGKLW